MYKLIVTEAAHQDLDNIVAYISVQLSNPKSAGEFANAVTACHGFLKNNPVMYERCQDGRLRQEGYRKAVIKNYVLVYKVNEASQTVSIMRCFYGAQDYTKLI